jgi:hypothetical protein
LSDTEKAMGEYNTNNLNLEKLPYSIISLDSASTNTQMKCKGKKNLESIKYSLSYGIIRFEKILENTELIKTSAKQQD